MPGFATLLDTLWTHPQVATHLTAVTTIALLMGLFSGAAGGLLVYWLTGARDRRAVARALSAEIKMNAGSLRRATATAHGKEDESSEDLGRMHLSSVTYTAVAERLGNLPLTRLTAVVEFYAELGEIRDIDEATSRERAEYRRIEADLKRAVTADLARQEIFSRTRLRLLSEEWSSARRRALRLSAVALRELRQVSWSLGDSIPYDGP